MHLTFCFRLPAKQNRLQLPCSLVKRPNPSCCTFTLVNTSAFSSRCSAFLINTCKVFRVNHGYHSKSSSQQGLPVSEHSPRSTPRNLQIHPTLQRNPGVLPSPSYNILTPDSSFNIFRVNGTIKQEAASTLYGQNILAMSYYTGRPAYKVQALLRYFHMVGKLNCSLIRNLEFHSAFMVYLETATKLLEAAKRKCQNLHQVAFKVLKRDWPAGTTLYPAPSRPVVPMSEGQYDSVLKRISRDCHLSIETHHGFHRYDRS